MGVLNLLIMNRRKFMKKLIVPLMKKAGERAAQVPINARSWPTVMHQSKMPDSLRNRMKEQDKK